MGKKADRPPKDPSTVKKDKHKYRKDKPWDDGTIDHWKIDKFDEEDNKGGTFLEESSFAVLFPQYREVYLKEAWPEVEAALKPHGIKAELDLSEGSMTVRTTSRTFDPFIIIKARDVIKLLSRSVPVHQAVRALDDGVYVEIVKIGGLVRNKEKFVKRRQRLVGPNGSTLKALELLTNCYILVQGQTVSIIGSTKGIKQASRVIIDCFANVHPVYHIKELMIKRELEKDEELKGENWDKFLPQFKKRNVKRKKNKKPQVKEEKPLFPPEQQPRKEDIAMMTGEAFLGDEAREKKRLEDRAQRQASKVAEKRAERAAAFVPPAKPKPGKDSTSEPVKGETWKDQAERVKKNTAKKASKREGKTAGLL